MRIQLHDYNLSEAMNPHHASAALIDLVPKKPKRLLTAYNFFFQAERGRLLDSLPSKNESKSRRSHGKIGFADLARTISKRWKSLDKDGRGVYDELADQDKIRYEREMKAWNVFQKRKQHTSRMNDKSPGSVATCVSASTTATDGQDFSVIDSFMQSRSQAYQASLQFMESSPRSTPRVSASQVFKSLEELFQDESAGQCSLLQPNYISPYEADEPLPVYETTNFQGLADQLGSDCCKLLIHLFSDEELLWELSNI